MTTSTTAAAGSLTPLPTGAEALLAAVSAGGDQLPAPARDLAAAIAARVAERSRIAGGHTVVALAGATGSGKSSLFNALVGASVAEVGARRPITSTPHAAVWGADPGAELLDWLGVGRRHRVVDVAPEIFGALGGLVLLDLPDFDSRVVEHRSEASRVLDLVDLFIWVTDPQKYADAVLHDEFVAARSALAAVTIVVLNHADALTPAGLRQCHDDLVRLLRADGLADPEVIVTSARTGYGVPQLRQRISAVVAGHTAAEDRLRADVGAAAAALRASVADTEPEFGDPTSARLVDALSRAAGVPVVLKALEQDYIRESVGHTGWVFTRWSRAFSPEPLKRLRLDRVETRDGIPVGETDIRAVLGRSSIPPPSPAARADVDLATREVGRSAAQGLPKLWARAVAEAAQPAGADLHDELDRAIVGTPLRAPAPRWWQVFDVMQWLVAAVAVAGLLWYLVLAVAGWLQFALPEVSRWGIVPYPFVMLGGGLLAGLLLTAAARVFSRAGARRRRALVEGRLRTAIAAVAERRVIDPVARVLARHRLAREQLDLARSCSH